MKRRDYFRNALTTFLETLCMHNYMLNSWPHVQVIFNGFMVIEHEFARYAIRIERNCKAGH